MTDTVWINGNFIPGAQAALPISDSGVTTGLGVFDTLRAQDGKLLFGHDHYQRLIHDVQTVLRIDVPISEEIFIATAEKLLRDNGFDRGAARVRTTVTGGTVSNPLAPIETPTLFMSVGPVPENFPDIHAWIIDAYPRVAGNALENCKRLDYTRSYAARRDAEALGGNEALLTNTHGMLVCGTTSNLFIVEGGQWFTPPLSDGVLYGITRKHVMVDRDAREESMLPERVLKADDVYLSNSISGLRKITTLNGRAL